MLQTYSVTNTRNERHIYRPYNRVFGFCPKITAYDVSIPVLNTHTHTHTHTYTHINKKLNVETDMSPGQYNKQ